MPDDFDATQPTEDDRRRVPDVFSYRLGAVEKLSERNAQDLSKLERLVTDLVASMPSRYTTRQEHEKLADSMASLTMHLETYVATSNASNAIRERNVESRQTVRLQWPVWLLMAANSVLVLLALVLHHG